MGQTGLISTIACGLIQQRRGPAGGGLEPELGRIWIFIGLRKCQSSVLGRWAGLPKTFRLGVQRRVRPWLSPPVCAPSLEAVTPHALMGRREFMGSIEAMCALIRVVRAQFPCPHGLANTFINPVADISKSLF